MREIGGHASILAAYYIIDHISKASRSRKAVLEVQTTVVHSRHACRQGYSEDEQNDAQKEAAEAKEVEEVTTADHIEAFRENNADKGQKGHTHGRAV